MDWLDLLAVQGTLKSLLQHHSSKAPFVTPSKLLHLSDPWLPPLGSEDDARTWNVSVTTGCPGAVAPGENDSVASRSVLRWQQQSDEPGAAIQVTPPKASPGVGGRAPRSPRRAQGGLG